MESVIKQDKYLGRGIHNEFFFESLTNGNLKKMLSVINIDNDLDVQIRKNYLNIYYNGGNIAKVNSEKSIEFDKFYFNWNTKDFPTNKIDEIILKEITEKRNKLIGKFKEGKYKEYFDDAKAVMKKWQEENPKPEREDQHQLSIENKYGKSDYTILDLEYQVSTLSDFTCLHIPKGKDNPKKPRFDIIAIDKQGTLCVIELKKGTGALGNTSGLKEHWECYQDSIGRNHESFMTEMRKLLEQKQAFDLIDKELKIIKSIPEFMFAYSYDKKKTPKEQDDAFQNEYKNVGAPIRILKLAFGTYKLLD